MRTTCWYRSSKPLNLWPHPWIYINIFKRYTYAISHSWKMSDNDSLTTRLLQIVEFFFKPLKMLARVIFIFEEIPIHNIASLSVQANNLGVTNGCTIFEFQSSWVIAILSVSFIRIRIKPGSPGWRIPINRWIGVWELKVLDVNRPNIMIALDWIISNAFSSKFLFNHISDVYCGHDHVILCYRSKLMMCVIACPE